jgi:hypothetical protein
MEDKVRFEKLLVRINGVSIELTIEEAKDLQESLNKLFGPEKEIVIQKEYWPCSDVKWNDLHPTLVVEIADRKKGITNED